MTKRKANEMVNFLTKQNADIIMLLSEQKELEEPDYDIQDLESLVYQISETINTIKSLFL